MKNLDLIQVDLNVIRDLTQSLLDDEKFHSFSHGRFGAQLQTIVDKVRRIESFLLEEWKEGEEETKETKNETGVDPETQKILDSMK